MGNRNITISSFTKQTNPFTS